MFKQQPVDSRQSIKAFRSILTQLTQKDIEHNLKPVNQELADSIQPHLENEVRLKLQQARFMLLSNMLRFYLGYDILQEQPTPELLDAMRLSNFFIFEKRHEQWFLHFYDRENNYQQLQVEGAGNLLILNGVDLLSKSTKAESILVSAIKAIATSLGATVSSLHLKSLSEIKQRWEDQFKQLTNFYEQEFMNMEESRLEKEKDKLKYSKKKKQIALQSYKDKINREVFNDLSEQEIAPPLSNEEAIGRLNALKKKEQENCEAIDKLIAQKTERTMVYGKKLSEQIKLSKKRFDTYMEDMGEGEFTKEQINLLALIDEKEIKSVEEIVKKKARNAHMAFERLPHEKKIMACDQELHKIIPRTYLARACGEGLIVRVKFLLKRGYLLSVRDNRGNYPIHQAMQCGEKAVELLELLKPEPGFSIEQPGRFGKTPLHVAAKYGNHAAAQWLLQHGAKPNVYEVGPFQGNTPLHHAVYYGHIDVLLLLLGLRDINRAPKNKTGLTPLAESLLSPHISGELLDVIFDKFAYYGCCLTVEDWNILEDKAYQFKNCSTEKLQKIVFWLRRQLKFLGNTSKFLIMLETQLILQESLENKLSLIKRLANEQASPENNSSPVFQRNNQASLASISENLNTAASQLEESDKVEKKEEVPAITLSFTE